MFHSVVAVMLPLAVVAALALTDWWGKLAVVVGVALGANAMRIVYRRPWGEARASELKAVDHVLLIGLAGGLAYGLPNEAAGVVGAIAGLTGYSYVCNVRSGRLRLFGVWPSRR